MTPRSISAKLRAGSAVTDHEFDRFLPRDLQLHSDRHWTPLDVIRRAARWLDDLGVRTLVDIGSGAGKFCVAGALTSRCIFKGIEQRPRLVEAARALARMFEVEDRVQFVESVLGEQESPLADAYYLYNPFGENLLTPDERLDGEVEVSNDRYLRDLTRLKVLLREAPLGTLVLTYYGFGARLPSGYEDITPDDASFSLLQMWRKVDRGWFSRPGCA